MYLMRTNPGPEISLKLELLSRLRPWAKLNNSTVMRSINWRFAILPILGIPSWKGPSSVQKTLGKKVFDFQNEIQPLSITTKPALDYFNSGRNI